MGTPFAYSKALQDLKYCWLAVLLLALQQAGWASPQRIVSLNLCTDLMLLQMVEPSRIAALSHLAAEAQYSPLWQQAQALPRHSGLAEEVIALEPDLILAPAHMRGARPLLARAGYPIAEVALAQNLGDIYSATREIGRLTGNEAEAEQLVSQLQRRVSQSQAQHRSLDKQALVYAPNGHTAGKNTFKNEILKVAGYRNTAAELGIQYYGNLSIEQVLYAQPDLIIIDDSTENQASLAQKFTAHPVMQKLNTTQFIQVHAGLWLCASPLVTQVLDALDEARHD